MRTVIYARFSSDNQNPRSAADQIALCRERADAEGWPVVAVFEDNAISGAAGINEQQRPGLNAMLALVEMGGVDQVLAESTDRISRHIADSHIIRERIEFAGARLYTLFDGAVTPMVGLIKGFTDAQFRTDLAARVRRGQRGAVSQGRSSGGVAFGYRRVSRFDDHGNAIPGLREIDPERAEIVRRIFREYAAGRSARQISAALNSEGIDCPRSGFWRDGTISGSKRTGFGILRNRIYIGKIVYGRTQSVVNPISRRKMMRPVVGEAPHESDAPHLRIIDDELWNRVQELLEQAGFEQPERQRRPKHLLSGLGECEVCGSPWTKCSREFWGCSRAHAGNGCSNKRMINTRLYQERVIADLKSGMLAPEIVAAYVREYRRDFARKTAQLTKQRDRLEQRLGEANRKLRRLVDAIAAGGSEFAEIRHQLAAVRADRDAIAAELASVEALPQVLTLHPNLDEQYRREVEDLEAALAQPEAELEAVPRFRAMIAKIIVRPSAGKRGVELEVVRRIDEILSIATRARA